MKQRITITLDDELAQAAAAAVDQGSADSVSAYVNAAVRQAVVHQQRRAALDHAIAVYEAEHGEITSEELAQQRRDDRDAAAAVRARRPKRRGAA